MDKNEENNIREDAKCAVHGDLGSCEESYDTVPQGIMRPSLDAMETDKVNKYTLATIIAKRAREINEHGERGDDNIAVAVNEWEKNQITHVSKRKKVVS